MIGVLDIILIVLFAVVAPFFVYLTAKKNGHKSVYWALLTLAVGIFCQVILPGIIGIVVAVALVALGNSPNSIAPTMQNYSLVIGVSCSILNVIGVLLVMRRVSRANIVAATAESSAPQES